MTIFVGIASLVMGMVIVVIAPAVVEWFTWMWKNRRRSDLAHFTVHNTAQGKASKPTPCQHDSRRIDSLLDNHCMRCGADGYWLSGYRLDVPHPGGKTLLRIPDR